MTPAPISVERLRELLVFLDGSGQLDGRSFGDDGPIINGIRRNYWWRADLRHIAALLQQLEEMEAEVESTLACNRGLVRLNEAVTARAESAQRAREEATGLLRRVNASLYLLDKPHREFGGVTDKTATDIAAFLAASGGAAQ